MQTDLKQAQLAFSLKQEELTRLNKEAAALATELGSVKQALHLEREASRNQAKKVVERQAVEARAAVLEVQLADNRTKRMTMAVPLAIGAPSGFGFLDRADGRWRS